MLTNGLVTFSRPTLPFHLKTNQLSSKQVHIYPRISLSREKGKCRSTARSRLENWGTLRYTSGNIIMFTLPISSFLLLYATATLLHTTVYSATAPSSSSSKPANFLRVALDGLQDSDPSQVGRISSPRADGGAYHSLYDKGPVIPGAGVVTRHFFISEDYTVFDGGRNRVVPFFDPETLINCDCEQPFPPELDIPHRFAVYNPVTVQAPLPDVPRDLYGIKYTGHYYACPLNTNPYEFAWYNARGQQQSPCKWMWYQNLRDSLHNNNNNSTTF